MLRPALLALAALVLASSSGCSLFNQVRIDPIATSFQRPSNVAGYVAVTAKGKPVGNLEPENFRVYENELLLSADDTQRLILPQELAAYHHTLLLVDASGEPAALEPLSHAVAGFVEIVRSTQAVSVFAFDGRPKLRFVGEFSKSTDKAPVDLRALAKLGPSDTSRNLNGALKSGLEELDARLAQQSKPVKVGTLVVFTLGADLAGRVSQAEAERALSQSKHDVLALGIAEQAATTLRDIGTAGVLKAQDADSLGVLFEEAAAKTRDLYEKYYLIAYCSPARAGTRRLKVEVRFRNSESEQVAASFSQDFDASGFGPGCRSETPPRFVSIARERAADAPAPEVDSVVPPPDKPGYSH